jgi:membrane-associated phospholipid phosphatase
MLAATPIDGGHYFIDLIAGIAVALASVWVARRLDLAPARPRAVVETVATLAGAAPTPTPAE